MARGLFAGHHIGDKLSFVDGPMKDREFVLKSHDLCEDIHSTMNSLVKEGCEIAGLWLGPHKRVETKEEIRDISTGRIIMLESDSPCAVVVYGTNKYDSCGPGGFGMRYSNCPELYPLKPQDLGLDQEREHTRKDVMKTVVPHIVDSDMDKSLKGYLCALISYYVGDESEGLSEFISEIYSDKLDGFPVSQIQKNFGEVIAPLAILSKKGSLFEDIGLSHEDKVCYPKSKTQDMVDFYIMKSGVRYYFSSKSGNKVSNTVKPGNIVPAVEKDPYLLRKYGGKLEYSVMSALHNNSAVDGPIEAGYLLRDKVRRLASITTEVVDDWKSKSASKGQSWEMSDLYSDLVDSLGCEPTFGSILYHIEKWVAKSSKKGRVLDYTSLFSEVAGSRINYISLDSIGADGIPKFKVSHAYFPEVELRTKNSKERIGFDKIGIQVITE
jgi:hypothetical protein